MSEQTTRDQIVEAADRLFYRHGFEHTSFSDIADVVRISRGNFYYHFKSKNEILDAVIEARLAHTAGMLEHWERDGKQPVERIRHFIHMMAVNRNDIMRYGCPVGTLCSELAKLGHPTRGEANKLLVLFRTWLRQQFTFLGYAEEADTLAMHLLARSQGLATLANAFHDEKFIQREVAWMEEWLAALAPAAVRRRGKTARKRAKQGA